MQDETQTPGEQPEDTKATEEQPENPITGSQGESQPTAPEHDPDRQVAQSAPPPEAQSGVPQLPDGANEGVEPGETPASPSEPQSGEPQEPDQRL